MSKDVQVNLLATAVMTGILIAVLILLHAPTWGWVGFAYICWIVTVNLEVGKRKR